MPAALIRSVITVPPFAPHAVTAVDRGQDYGLVRSNRNPAPRGARAAPLEAPGGRPRLRAVLLRARLPQPAVGLHPPRPGAPREGGCGGRRAIAERGARRPVRHRCGGGLLPGGR